jgi:multicomponent Na+:H+ antiporter subunit G
MQTVLYLIAIVAVVVGTAFSLIGVLGFVRLPDVYTRLHATGKVGVFGGVLLMAGVALVTPAGLAKGLLLIVLLMFVGPATSHCLSSAAYRMGIRLRPSVRDDLRAACGVPPASTETGADFQE